jgi:hypothetical protein
MTPEVYATAFHEIRSAIKAADPTARIGIGGLVEATPLRLAYLDRVWNSYASQYGHSMGKDIDVWSIHGFLLREVRHSWGAEIPAGFDNEDADPNNNYRPQDGFLYGANTATVIAQHHNIHKFKEFTTALRRWMADHGERTKPLINTEYGILYKSVGRYTIGASQVNAYMVASLNYLLTATSTQIGYPLDENRLVQSWFWYSLNDDDWNGNLFNPNTKALTTFGRNWKTYVSSHAHPLASRPLRNLLVANLRASPNPARVPRGQTATVMLKVDVANSGNTITATGNRIQVSFWEGYPGKPHSRQIGGTQMINDLPGCGGFATVEVAWPNLTPGKHVWYAKVKPIDHETHSDDNIKSGVVWVVVGAP